MISPGSKIRVLYVCPTAHWAGHYPLMMDRESRLLLQTGLDIGLCTFQGTSFTESDSRVPAFKVVSKFWGFPLKIFSALENTARPFRALAWIVENISTLWYASHLVNSKQYDVIFLRDIDPFIFLPFCLGYFRRNQKWVYSLIGYPLLRRPGTAFYKFSHASFWKNIYRRSMSRNRYLGICENAEIKDTFENSFLDGILKNNLQVLHGAVERSEIRFSGVEARSKLGLPQDKTILLHFGFLHSGKDFSTVIKAAERLNDILVVHAGASSIDIDLDRLKGKSPSKDKIVLLNHYIPEEEKPLYFAAADVVLLAYKKDFIQSASMLWEAAKFNKPLIASNAGYLGEMVNKYGSGLLYEPEDVESLTKTIILFLSMTGEQKEKLAENHTKFLDDFSARKWAESLKTLIAGICSADQA